MRVQIMIAATLLLAAPAAEAQRQPVNERFAASPTGSLRVDNLAGRVEIQGWDRNEISITGTLGPAVERLEVVQGERAVIRVVHPRGRSGSGDASARLTIRVPAGRSVEVSVVSSSAELSDLRGNVRVQAVSGAVGVSGAPREAQLRSVSGAVRLNTTGSERVSVQTASGSVTVEGTIRGRAEIESISGSVRISGTSGDVRARTASGSLTVQGATGSVDLASVSGRAQVEAGTLSRLSFRSVSGGLRYEGGLARGSNTVLETHSGTLDLRLPANLAADFEVDTFSGRIQNDFGPGPQRTSQYGPGWELRFTSGQGGASVVAKTFSGSVRIQRQ